MTDTTPASTAEAHAVAGRLDRPVRPCAWWVPAFSEPLVSRGEAKPMLWPEAKPLYELTAEEVAAVNKFRARRAWMSRDTGRCKCDHNEYCEHCWPVSFRPGGPWHGLGA